VDAASSFFQYWYYHLPNYVLAIMLYACLGRFLLGLFVPQNWDNYIWKGFVLVSNPAVVATRFVTPAAVPTQLLLVFAMLWLMAIRVVLFFEFARWGLAPRITGV